ncbi:MAG: hypothetical protein RIC38_10820, partial [Chromatocurvus sp.]
MDNDAHYADRKQALLQLIDAADGEGKYQENQFDQLMQAINELLPHSPIPQPMDEQHAVASPWRTLFACFGPKHSAGKTLVHDTLLSYQSFNKFPAVPVRVTRLEQEIHAGTHEYNNLAYLTAPDGSTEAIAITRGHYDEDADNRQRYNVTFHTVELISQTGSSDDDLRRAFDLPSDQPMSVELK